MNQNTTLITAVILALIIGVIGGVVGFHYFQQSAEKPTGTSEPECPSEEEIKEDFVKELRDKNVLPEVPDIIDKARGEITKIEDRQVSIKTYPSKQDILHEYLNSNLTVNVTSTINLVKDKYPIEEDSNPPTTEIDFSDLKEGQQIIIYSDQDLKQKSQLDPQKVQIIRVLATSSE